MGKKRVPERSPRQYEKRLFQGRRATPAAPQGAPVLLEAVAVLPHQGFRADQARHLPANGHLGRLEPERSLEIIPHLDPLRHDQSMAQGSRLAFYQRSVGKHALPGYGSVTHGNRLVRTRMPGGVGAGGEIPTATRLGQVYKMFILVFFQELHILVKLQKSSLQIEVQIDSFGKFLLKFFPTENSHNRDALAGC
ncbi:MAG: hypothetical protein RBQ88_08455 [Desulfobulbus oligotrophicus]|jgi:hypothetical protein|nr:hypothetical protein [Desulfobulbus oligotrophicus]